MREVNRDPGADNGLDLTVTPVGPIWIADPLPWLIPGRAIARRAHAAGTVIWQSRHDSQKKRNFIVNIRSAPTPGPGRACSGRLRA